MEKLGQAFSKPHEKGTDVKNSMEVFVNEIMGLEERP